MVGGVDFFFFFSLLIFARIKSSFSVFPVVINPLRAQRPRCDGGTAGDKGGFRQKLEKPHAARTPRLPRCKHRMDPEWWIADKCIPHLLHF